MILAPRSDVGQPWAANDAAERGLACYAGLQETSALIRTHVMKVFVLAGSALLLGGLLTSCSRAPEKAAAKVKAAAEARANTLREERRAAEAANTDEQRLERIPLPSKNVYESIHVRRNWKNPFLVVRRSALTLSTNATDMATPKSRRNSASKKAAAKQPGLELKLSDLPAALSALPQDAWPLGRVIAVQEDPAETRKDRPEVRRNLENTLQVLNNLGVVTYDWPQRAGR